MSSITPERSTPWSSRTVFIVGGGPSLRGRNMESLRDRGIVLGVNCAAEFVPVDATFSLDHSFIRRWAARIELWARDHDVCLAVDDSYDGVRPAGVHWMRRIQRPGWSSTNGTVHSGRNSGYGALNLALLMGAREIVLLGYDMMRDPADRSRHWHDGHGRYAGMPNDDVYRGWCDEHDKAELPPGVEVWNANPESRLRTYPIRPYEEWGL